MENTKENISKFRALYWGQKVLQSFSYTAPIQLTGHWIDSTSIHEWLILRSSDSLTDEEYIEIAKIVWPERRYNHSTIEGKRYCTNIYVGNDPTMLVLRITDYLRSIGVFIPYMGEYQKILDFGWVVLRKEVAG